MAVKFHRRVQWTVVFAIGTWLEWKALSLPETESTLSEATRFVFKTQTSSLGRKIFTAFWTVLYLWYLKHILEGPKPRQLPKILRRPI